MSSIPSPMCKPGHGITHLLYSPRRGRDGKSHRSICQPALPHCLVCLSVRQPVFQSKGRKHLRNDERLTSELHTRTHTHIDTLTHRYTQRHIHTHHAHICIYTHTQTHTEIHLPHTHTHTCTQRVMRFC